MEYRRRYGPWALVTGASSGLGAAFARALAARGLDCILTARRVDRLEDLAGELRGRTGVAVRVLPFDLARPEAAGQLVQAVADLEIGLLVNNAGFGLAGRFTDQDPDRLRDLFELNCTVPIVLARALLPAMEARGRGGMIVVSSSAGLLPLPRFAAYAGAKACSLLWAEALWYELRPRGVDVLALAPGTVDTEFQAVAGQAPHRGRPAAAVVEAALARLGRRPSCTPGWWYWLRARAPRLMPVRWALALGAFYTGRHRG